MSIYAPWVRPVGASLSACLSACLSTFMSVCLSIRLSSSCGGVSLRPATTGKFACSQSADLARMSGTRGLQHPVLHLRLHRGLAPAPTAAPCATSATASWAGAASRARPQRVHDGHHTCHKFANVSTCPLECEFEPGYSGDGYMMCNNISCRWSDDALNPAFESRTWPIRAGGSPGPSITLQRFPRSGRPPPHMALGLISGLVSCMGGNGNGNVIGNFSSQWLVCLGKQRAICDIIRRYWPL